MLNIAVNMVNRGSKLKFKQYVLSKFLWNSLIVKLYTFINITLALCVNRI